MTAHAAGGVGGGKRRGPRSRVRGQTLRLFANQATDALESAARYEQLRELANRDPLTGLLNRRAFIDRLGEAAKRSFDLDRPLALAYCDLDNFKTLNDSCGHAAGDQLLHRYAHGLSSSVRAEDLVFRIGGDEFAVLLPGCDRERALSVLDRLVRDALLLLADEAMYAAKRARSAQPA
jgi:GGDEF domain-containing protein